MRKFLFLPKKEALSAEEIRQVYDGFFLDEETRRTVLNNLIASSSEKDGGENQTDTRRGAVEQLHPANSTLEEEKRPARFFKHFGAVAAGILGGILILGGVAYAWGWIRAKDVQMDAQTIEYEIKETLKEKERPAKQGEEQLPQDNVVTEHKMNVNYPVSMVGRKGTPEYEASQEWQQFFWANRESFLDDEPDSENDLKSYYTIYSCYTKGYRDKLDEILGKYDLKPRHSVTYVKSLDELCEGAGIDRIFPKQQERTDPDYNYWYYDDGSFGIERAVDYTSKDSLITYRLDRNVYGFLGTTFWQLDLSTLSEWHYITKEGIEVTAFERTEAMTDENGHKSPPLVVFMIDRPESFVTISILYDELCAEDGYTVIGYDIPTREWLQDFLDSICLENIS